MSIPVTPGSGVVVAADQVGTASAPATGQLLQYVKLDAGAAGASAPVTSTAGLPVAPGDNTNVFKSASAVNLNAKSSQFAQLASFPGQWAVSNQGGVGAQSTATQAAAGAGIRNICQAFAAQLMNDATGSANAPVVVNIRDGATGAGTVLMTFLLAGIANTAYASSPPVSLSGLNLVGSANTAMTIETASGTPAGAHTEAFVTMAGTTSV